MTGYYPRDEERAGYRAARDTEALNASYERFLRTGVSVVVFLHNHLQTHSQLTLLLNFLANSILWCWTCWRTY
jgi:hypothetical protein